MNHADFRKANISGAILNKAKINRLHGGNGSITLAENMRGVSIAGADISAISFLPPEGRYSPTFGTKDTKLSWDLISQREDRTGDMRQFAYFLQGSNIKDVDDIRIRLKEAGFLYWPPYNSDDWVTEFLRKKLWSDIGLKGFPYDDG